MKVDLNHVRALVEECRSRAAAAQFGTPQRLGNRSWFRIENRPAVEGGSGGNVSPSTDIYLYDAIGEWGVTAQDFVDALRGVVTGTITMYVNCEGGEVFDGLAIYEALRRHPANVTAFVDGIAASAASFVVMAADRIVMAERARMMIHDAHGIAMGNARDMRSMADLLDNLSTPSPTSTPSAPRAPATTGARRCRQPRVGLTAPGTTPAQPSRRSSPMR
jgi:ATP-dependent protease ClpP protease subunit